MKTIYSKLLLWITLACVCMLWGSEAENLFSKGIYSHAVNGGISCAICTTVLALVEQLAEFRNESVVHSLERLCSYAPPKFRPLCKQAADSLGPPIIQLVIEEAGPDVACHALRFCYTEQGHATCTTVTPPWQKVKAVSIEAQALKHRRSLIKRGLWAEQTNPNFCMLPGIKEICLWVKKIFTHIEPLLDQDNDGFSPMFTLRGSAWRGKDCADEAKNIRPGALPIDGDAVLDSNCNGIFGVNPNTSQPYEEELCANTQAKGIAVIGDSISAHFHLPPQWLDATQISELAFAHFEMIIENQMDWPMLSSVTGYARNEWPEVIQGPLDSFYLRLKERNRCNHRDYHNIAVNGATSKSASEFIKYLGRRKDKDKPMVVAYALVGNDVCNGYPDTFTHMTTRMEMLNNTLKGLQVLHETLPNNSHVILVGLADGRNLFDSMYNRTHPLASYWGGFTYSTFYDYFNCLQISPCVGWMNTNETVRELTFKRAAELSDILKEVAIGYSEFFSNFHLHYLENPINEVIDNWIQAGGEAWQLIEPSDGFHCNQIGEALISKTLWNNIMTLTPDIFGPENPNNDAIEQLFGDQGGH